MLRITSGALDVIRQVTDHPSLEPHSGVRIAHGEEPDSPLQVRAVAAPMVEDSVLERSGGRIFLGPGVAEHLSGGDLDTSTGSDGRVHFVLRAAS